MKTFYEQHWDNKAKGKVFYSPVGGEPVNFPGYEETQFFIHEAHDFYFRFYDPQDVSYWWDVHEAKTGMLIASGDTRENAYSEAKERLKKKTPEEVKNQVEKMSIEYGISPLFRRKP